MTTITAAVMHGHTIPDRCLHHTKADGSWWAKDAGGIELARVCDRCEAAKLASYRREVLTDSNYSHEEPIDSD
jgi:hypothetical protein